MQKPHETAADMLLEFSRNLAGGKCVVIVTFGEDDDGGREYSTRFVGRSDDEIERIRKLAIQALEESRKSDQPKKRRASLRVIEGGKSKALLSGSTPQCRHAPFEDRCAACYTPPGGWIKNEEKDR